MKKTTYVVSILLPIILVALSCSSLDPIAQDDVNTGSADFARFHAIGCSFTAGTQNGGLVEGFQEVAWPAVVANAAQAPTFAFPNISENGIPPLMYVRNFSPLDIVTPEAITAGKPTNLAFAGVYNNMGIPGATLHMLMTKRPDPGSDTNPFFGIVLRDSSMLGDQATAVAQTAAAQPTLLAVWAGISEILGPAKAGTDAPLTPTVWFEEEYGDMMDTFDSAANAVVAANIPDITASPYFTAIPPFVVNPATGQLVLDQDGHPIPLLGIHDGGSGNLPPNALVILPAADQLALGIGIPDWIPGGGSGQPLGDEYILDPTEAAAIRARINEFNVVIATVCADRNIPVVDIHALYERWTEDGFEMRGETYTTAFLSSSLFGVDGLHPNAIGYYAIALEFIGVINSAFNAAIPEPKLPLGPYRE